MLGNIFAPLGMKIAGGVAIGAALLAGILAWQLSNARADRDAEREARIMEEAKHAITRQSVDTLEAALAKFVGEGKARRAAQLAEIEKQAKLSTGLRNYAARIRAEIEKFSPADPCDCSTPDFVMEGRQ